MLIPLFQPLTGIICSNLPHHWECHGNTTTTTPVWQDPSPSSWATEVSYIAGRQTGQAPSQETSSRTGSQKLEEGSAGRRCLRRVSADSAGCKKLSYGWRHQTGWQCRSAQRQITTVAEGERLALWGMPANEAFWIIKCRKTNLSLNFF